MKRSDRHKINKQSQDQDLEKTRENIKAQSDDDKSRSNNVKNDKLEQGKKYVSTKLSAYNTQLKKENEILKEKFTNLRSGNREANDGEERKRPVIPIIVTGILLLPITILLAFLLITNFLPDETDMNRIASNDATEDTEEDTDDETDTEEDTDDETDTEEDTDEETDTEDSETTPDDADVASGEDEETTDVDEGLPEQTTEPEILTTADYSSAQRQQLQRAAQNAVNEKNAELAERREQEALARQRAAEQEARQRAAEEEARRQAEAQQQQEQENEEETEEDTETEETPSAGGQVHTVTGEDNLYRIAIQYYGDGSAANIQRIREANGLTGDNLEVGQTLTIP